MSYATVMPQRATRKDEVSTASNTTKVLAENLGRLMRFHHDLDSNPKLSKKSGLGLGTISRLRNGDVDPNLATLESLAGAFGLSPWQMLVPHMDPANTPALQPITESERKLYERLREVAREIKDVG